MSRSRVDASTLQTLLAHAPGYIYLLDLDYYIVYMNRTRPPWTFDDVVGQKVDIYFAPEVLVRVHEIYKKVLASAEAHNIEYHIDYTDGKREWYNTWISAFKDESGAITGLINITTDITEHKETEFQIKKMHADLLEASHRAGMAEVATGILHNVGNVLNSVNVSATSLMEMMKTSHINLLVRAIKLCEEQGQNLPDFLANDPKGRKVPALLSRLGKELTAEQDAIRGEIKRLAEHINIIRSTVDAQQSMAKTGRLLGEALPGEIVERALSMFRIDFESKAIAVETDIEDSPPVVLDSQATLQILVNLLRNAIEALIEVEGPRKIRVETRTDDEFLYFEVIDNGCGISEEDLDKIFLHGFTTKQSGHGFGLHASAVAARTMGGKLEATSDGPGRGARFCLSLSRRGAQQ